MNNNTKLLVCTYCDDIVSLRLMPRSCECGRSQGSILSEGRCEVIGKYAVPIGFVNHSFVNAVKFRPGRGLGLRFEAFVFPQVSEAVKQGA
jgi:hypothetical protein